MSEANYWDVDQAANNPAGRVYWFLDQLRSEPEPHNSAYILQAAANILGLSPDIETHLALARIVVQIEAVDHQMRDHSDAPGFRAAFQSYSEVMSVRPALLGPAGHVIEHVMQPISTAGWNSLEYANDVLSRSSTEKRLSDQAQFNKYMNGLRDLIVEVREDETISPQDKRRVIDLLREVETALNEMRVTGGDRIENAAAAVAGVLISDRDLWDRVAEKKWVKRLGVVVGGLLLALGSAGGLPAISSMITEDKPEVVVIEQRDVEGQRVVGAEIVEDAS